MLQKIFGIGPIGAAISVILLLVALRADRALGHPQICTYESLMEILEAVLICAGLILLFWTMHALRNWWVGNRLCTMLLLWVVSLHPVWHLLVIREEKAMADHFGDEYRRYAGRTGRFLPRYWKSPRS